MATRRIGVLGSGEVGRALGEGFAGRGWEVTVGTRSPEALTGWADDVEGPASVGTFAEAAAHGDVVVLAVLGSAAEDVLGLAGDGNLAEKVVLDTSNPLDFSEEGPPHLLYGGTTSLGERIQARLPDARVVKCFNTVPNAQMVDPAFESETPPMPICGDDGSAKAETEALLVELGWPGALDVGDIRSARYLEAVVPLWVRAGTALGTWDHVISVVR